jgi:hypothetical protein
VKTGKLTVDVLAFRTTLFGDTAMVDDPSLDLGTVVPASSGLGSAPSWSVLTALGAVSESGRLSFPKNTLGQNIVYVRGTGTDLRYGRGAKGRVDVTILEVDLAARATALVGGTSSTTIVPAQLPEVVAFNGAQNRVWTLVPGQTLPAWLSLNADGTLRAAPQIPAESFNVYLRSVSADPSTPNPLTLRLTVSPVSFDATFATDSLRRAGSSIDLNTLLPETSALSGAVTWFKRASRADVANPLSTNLLPSGVLS